MKRIILAAVTVGCLTLGSVGVAAAQTGGTTSTSTQPAPNGANHAKHGRKGGVLHAAATALGVKPRDLVAGLCSGKTLAQLASQHGKSTQDLINAGAKAPDATIAR